MSVKIDPSWFAVLQPQFEAPYFAQLKEFLVAERQQHTCYPPGSKIFNAFDSTPFDKVKVVILGQDPYHEPGQAMGLCFSVPQGIQVPPSLVNIITEINSDLGTNIPKTCGDLSGWATQGVLLLNATLTVRQGQANSHSNHGWEQFTDAVISIVNANCAHAVFFLWGSYAQKKAALIDASRHLVLQSVHPSPLSAHRGFFGNHQFTKANTFLRSHGITEIKW